jgi:hypothetical protein
MSEPSLSAATLTRPVAAAATSGDGAICGATAGTRRRVALAVELLALYLGLPAAYLGFKWALPGVRVPVLAVGGVVALVMFVLLLRDRTFDRRQLLNAHRFWPRLAGVLAIFIPGAVLVGLGVAWFFPDKLFSLIQQRPVLWAMIMCLYPLFSVYPQEIVWRAFFFHRYRPLLCEGRWLAPAVMFVTLAATVLIVNAVTPGGIGWPALTIALGTLAAVAAGWAAIVWAVRQAKRRGDAGARPCRTVCRIGHTAPLIVTSAATFGYMHAIFPGLPLLAVAMTFVGGLIFAWRYHITRSLLITWIDHALWGGLIFTIGLGFAFYHATQQTVERLMDAQQHSQIVASQEAM